MSLKTLYYRLREVDTPVLLVVKDDKGFVSIIKRPLPVAVVNDSTMMSNMELGINKKKLKSWKYSVGQLDSWKKKLTIKM